MTDADFSDLVAEEVRGKLDPERTAFLHDPDNRTRWYDVLVGLKRDIETQFTERKADLESYRIECHEQGESGRQDFFAERADHQAWVASASRFKSGIEGRIQRVKRMIRADKDEGFVAQLKQLCHDAKSLVPDEHAGWHDRYADLFRRQN